MVVSRMVWVFLFLFPVLLWSSAITCHVLFFISSLCLFPIPFVSCSCLHPWVSPLPPDLSSSFRLFPFVSFMLLLFLDLLLPSSSVYNIPFGSWILYCLGLLLKLAFRFYLASFDLCLRPVLFNLLAVWLAIYCFIFHLVLCSLL